MKRLNASVMTVAVVLALIAFVAPSSAVLIGDHDITFVSHTFDGTYSNWTYEVTSGTQPSLSHWVLSWCNPTAMYIASEHWEYTYDDPNLHLKGIKFDTGYRDGETRSVWFMLLGDFQEGDVYVGTKAGDDDKGYGYVNGPINCNNPIPEFSTIAIPIASILGLLFFFNHRKRREK